MSILLTLMPVVAGLLILLQGNPMTLAEEANFHHILRTSGSANIEHMVTIQNHEKKLPVNACIQQETFCMTK